MSSTSWSSFVFNFLRIFALLCWTVVGVKCNPCHLTECRLQLERQCLMRSDDRISLLYSHCQECSASCRWVRNISSSLFFFLTFRILSSSLDVRLHPILHHHLVELSRVSSWCDKKRQKVAKEQSSVGKCFCCFSCLVFSHSCKRRRVLLSSSDTSEVTKNCQELFIEFAHSIFHIPSRPIGTWWEFQRFLENGKFSSPHVSSAVCRVIYASYTLARGEKTRKSTENVFYQFFPYDLFWLLCDAHRPQVVSSVK